MGLNYVRRPRREQLDMPNDFISVAIGDDHREFAHMDHHIIMQFEGRQYDRIDAQRRALSRRLIRGT